jgi:hypothetical protein
MADMTQSALPVAEYVGAADRAKGIYDDLMKRRKIAGIRYDPEFGAKFTIDPATGRKIFESGPLVSRATAEDILAGSPVSELHPNNFELERLTGKNLTAQGLKQADPEAFFQMQKARDLEPGQSKVPGRLEGLAQTGMMYDPVGLLSTIPTLAERYYLPMLKNPPGAGSAPDPYMPVPLQDQLILP